MTADRKWWRQSCGDTAARVTVDVRDTPTGEFSLLAELAADPENGLLEVEPGVYVSTPQVGTFLRSR